MWLGNGLRHGGRPEGHSHLVEAVADAGHDRRAEHAMSEVGNAEHHAESGLDACHVVGGKLSHLIASTAVEHVHLTDEVRELSCVDLHRTRGGTQSVCGACLVAVVFVLSFERGEPLWVFASGLEVANLALNGNSHS